MRNLADMKVALVVWETTLPETSLFESETDPTLLNDIELYKRSGTPYKLFVTKD